MGKMRKMFEAIGKVTTRIITTTCCKIDVLFEAIGKVITRIMGVVAGVYIATILPLWLGAILTVCAFIVLVIAEMEK